MEPRLPVGNGNGNGKDGGADLRSLRERYFAILEQQVVFPLQNELTARDEHLRERVETLDPEAPDAEIVRRGVEAEAQKIRAVLDVLESGMVRVRSAGLRELQVIARPSSAAG